MEDKIKTKTINVNELRGILEKHFRFPWVYIIHTEVANSSNQWKPLRSDIGMGGVCSITFEYKEDKK